MTESEAGLQDQPSDVDPADRPKLFRSADDRMLAGVCGGLGEYFGLEAIWFRLGFIMLTVGGGSSALIYGLLWLVVPEQPGSGSQSASQRTKPSTALIFGLALIAFGTMALVNMIDRSVGRFFWPVLFVIAGLLLIWGGRSDDRE